MRIELKKNEFEKLLERVEMKGKYYDGDKAKNGVLSNHAYMYIDNKIDTDRLVVINGDNTTACVVMSSDVIEEIIETRRDTTCVLDINKLTRYLKPFGDTVFLTVTSFVELDDGDSKAALPIVIEHPGIAMVNLLKDRQHNIIQPLREENYVLGTAGNLPSFGKIQYDNGVKIPVAELREAIKGCDITNLARYEFIFDGEILTLKSERGRNDSYSVEITVTDCVGDGANVEFTGNITKFLGDDNEIYLYLKDDSPLLVATSDSLLVKAPYLRR
jgi:hypothetical protein